MNFDQAVFEMNLVQAEDIKAPATIVINFEDGKHRYSASLYAPDYYKEKEETLRTVKRAWEYACHSDEDMLYSIASIVIDYKGEANEKEKTINKKITA